MDVPIDACDSRDGAISAWSVSPTEEGRECIVFGMDSRPSGGYAVT